MQTQTIVERAREHFAAYGYERVGHKRAFRVEPRRHGVNYDVLRYYGTIERAVAAIERDIKRHGQLFNPTHYQITVRAGRPRYPYYTHAFEVEVSEIEEAVACS